MPIILSRSRNNNSRKWWFFVMVPVAVYSSTVFRARTSTAGRDETYRSVFSVFLVVGCSSIWFSLRVSFSMTKDSNGFLYRRQGVREEGSRGWDGDLCFLLYYNTIFDRVVEQCKNICYCHISLPCWSVRPRHWCRGVMSFFTVDKTVRKTKTGVPWLEFHPALW